MNPMTIIGYYSYDMDIRLRALRVDSRRSGDLFWKNKSVETGFDAIRVAAQVSRSDIGYPRQLFRA
jgi:hypothetical protein